jgi:hypothetical protein
MSLTAVVAEAEWQLSSQPKASTLADALPAAKLPFEPDTLADQRTEGALQLTSVENEPLIVTRFANSCESVPETSTPIAREQVTVPERVATPVFAETLPERSTVSPICKSGSTCTVKLPLAWLPEASVAVQVTVVSPTAKNDPDAGEQLTVGFGSRSSLAETE